jgi:hypothetical protein
VSVMSRKQGTRTTARAAAKAAQARAAEKAARARAGAEIARQRARSTAAQFTPLAQSARTAATGGLYRARVWTAPQLDRASLAIQERMAPRLANALSAAARRVEPARPRMRRWPIVAAGITVLAAAGGAAFMLNRRGQLGAHLGHQAPGSEAQDSSEQAGQTAAADVNGQVRTP